MFKPEPLQLGNEGHLGSQYRDSSATASLFIILSSNAVLEAFSHGLNNQLYYSQVLGEMTQSLSSGQANGEQSHTLDLFPSFSLYVQHATDIR